jgi:hypothetical protein
LKSKYQSINAQPAVGVPGVINVPERQDFHPLKKKKNIDQKSPKFHEIFQNYLKFKQDHFQGGAQAIDDLNGLSLSPTANKIRYVNSKTIKFPKGFQ